LAEADKCIVVLSGGPDSAVVAYWAKKQGYEVHALTFKYGQIAEKEVKHATIIATKLGIPIKIINLSCLKDIFTGVTALCDKNLELTPTFTQPIIVPFRNAIFLSVAVAYAVSIEAAEVFYGAQGSDEPFYPDCREEFYKSFENTAKLGTGAEIRIEAPFSKLQKSEVLKIGMRLGVPFKLTWSCYRDEEKHCGTCESCVNRKNAFKEAKIEDPTEYIE
jgi:7-cyano-7-deazaguanine synthase